MDIQAIREELDELVALRSDLDDQDALIQAQPSAFPLNAVSSSQRKVLAAIFMQIVRANVGLDLPFDDSDDPDVLRPQIRFARGRIERRIKEIQRSLPLQAPDSQRSAPLTADPRCVFVIHGRNTRAKEDLFAFLRAINLDPIEWEEAVAMTGQGTPYVGTILDHAFSKSQAAIVFLTGDDMARLGTRFLKSEDPSHEKDLTPQARPNVLFEAGMAFGRYPERTIIVGLGPTRPFSDIVGRHVIHLSNAAQARLALANRLKTAGCSVRTDHRTDWLEIGTFDIAENSPDLFIQHESSRKVDPPGYQGSSSNAGGATSAVLMVHKKPFEFDPNCNTILLKWPEGLTLQIDQHKANGAIGLVVYVINETPKYMGSYRVHVAEALP
jgi:predicted nucleotide-binding protein